MVKGTLARFKAVRNVEAVEEAFRRSEKSIGDEAILSYMFDRMVFPK